MASTPRRPVPPVVPQSPEARSYFSSRAYQRWAPIPPPGVEELGEIETWEAVHAASAVRPDTPYVRAARFLNATGDMLAIALVAGSVSLSLSRLELPIEDLGCAQIPCAPRIELRR